MSVDYDVCKENMHVTANEQRNKYNTGNQPNQRLIIANMHNSQYIQPILYLLFQLPC